MATRSLELGRIFIGLRQVNRVPALQLPPSLGAAHTSWVAQGLDTCRWVARQSSETPPDLTVPLILLLLLPPTRYQHPELFYLFSTSSIL